MAHATRLNELADALVGSIIANADGRSQDLKQRIAQVVTGLKERSHSRTNQFDIEARLSGLVEKFAILNREDLSDALQTRLNQLPKEIPWLPDVLSLLLALSDKPLVLTNLAQLDSTDTEVAIDPALIWEEITEDDPFDEPSIWDDVERGYHSSGDDATINEGASDDTQASSVNDEDPTTLASLYVLQPDDATLEPIRASQGNLQDASNSDQCISELTLIRETLSMLRGLPTKLYSYDATTQSISFSHNHSLATSARSTAQDVLVQFADIGSRLRLLRQWAKSKQSFAHLESIQGSTERLLTQLNFHFAAIEQRYSHVRSDRVVSIIDVHTDAREKARPLLHISTVIRRASSKPETSDPRFTVLDHLYEETCIAHAAGDFVVFDDLSSLLGDGISTYLRPLQDWIRHGRLPQQESDTFLIEEVSRTRALGDVWHDRWAVRYDRDGRPSAPAFVHSFAAKAFAMGKSKAFLQLLDSTEDCDTDQAGPDASNPVFSPMVLKTAHSIAPFAETLRIALREWMTGMGDRGTSTLRSAILTDHGLDKTMCAVEYVYFSKDGGLFKSFAEALFERRQLHPTTWQDPFTLTELFQATIGTAVAVDGSSITVEVEQDRRRLAVSACDELSALQFRLHLSWPVQNVTRCTSPAIHSKAFVFLLQTCYAKYQLNSTVFDLKSLIRRRISSFKHINELIQLRQQLLCFVDCLHSHLVYTAAQLHAEMCSSMRVTEGIDDMTAVWESYEKSLAASLLLRESLAPIKNAIINVLELCEHLKNAWTTGWRDDSSIVTVPNCSHLATELAKHKAFIVVGLRGASRASAGSGLEALVVRLEWDGGSKPGDELTTRNG